jgi:hypothetical protein
MTTVSDQGARPDLFDRIHADLAPPRSRSGAFSVEAFLAADRPGADRNQTAVVLERIRRKVEIAGRLAAFYDNDLKTPIGPEIVDPSYARLLCAIFLQSAEEGCVRSLNTALKMLDGALKAPLLQPDAGLDTWASRLLKHVSLPHA